MSAIRHPFDNAPTRRPKIPSFGGMCFHRIHQRAGGEGSLSRSFLFRRRPGPQALTGGSSHIDRTGAVHEGGEGNLADIGCDETNLVIRRNQGAMTRHNLDCGLASLFGQR